MTNTGGMEEHGAVDILGGNADSSIFYKYEMSSLVKHSCSHMLVLCSLGWLLPWICLLLGGFYCAGLLATHFLVEGQRAQTSPKVNSLIFSKQFGSFRHCLLLPHLLHLALQGCLTWIMFNLTTPFQLRQVSRVCDGFSSFAKFCISLCKSQQR